MSTTFISPVGRLVQGSMILHGKQDMKGQPALDDKGAQIQECFIALAVPKTDANMAAFYALFDTQARASFPHLFPNGGACTHPKFAWKIQDGDGTNSSGQSVADKPGFAGNWIFKMATRYAPRCFHHGKYDPSQQIQNPDDVIKRGYFIRISGTIDGNGVQPGNSQAVPGLYVSPNLVELVAFGDEIVSGPDAAATFGGSAITSPLPEGASATPRVGMTVPTPSGLAPPPMPGGAPVAAPAGLPAPTLPGMAPAAPGLPAAPAGLPAPPAAAPQFQMQPSAQGATRETLHAHGWTDEQLLAAGHMI